MRMTTAFCLALCLAATARSAQPTIEFVGPGEYHCYFLVKGMVAGIGSNRAGQLGIGNTGAGNGGPIPMRMVFDERLRFVDVAAGGYHSLAADTTGHVWTWGSNYYGQRGDGTPQGEPGSANDPDHDGTPRRIDTDSEGKPFDHVVDVDSTLWFNLAIKDDGSIYVWGRNDDSNILATADKPGDRPVLINRPTRIDLGPDVRIKSVAITRLMIIALDDEGRVWTWGGGDDYPNPDRGIGSRDHAPPQQVEGLPPIKQVATGDRFNYALDTDGNLWGWGWRPPYLGLEGAPLNTPVKLDFPEFEGRKVAFVVASALTTHVILDDGSLWGWGDAAMGMVGNGDMLDFAEHNYSWNYSLYLKMVPRPVRIVPEVSNFKAVYTNAMCFFVYAMTDDGRVFSWGRNKTGILGNGIRPIGDNAGKPDSWNVPTATEVHPFAHKQAVNVPSKP